MEEAKVKFNGFAILLSDSSPVLLFSVKSIPAGEDTSRFKQCRGDIEPDEFEEYGEFTADEVDTSKGDAIHSGDAGICLSSNGEDSGSGILKFSFKHDTDESKVLATKFVLSNRGLTETRPSLIDEDDISGGKGTSVDVLGDKDDKVDELDDKGDSIPGPSLSIELFSPATHSRSSSKIPSSIESNVNGIIVSSFLFGCIVV